MKILLGLFLLYNLAFSDILDIIKNNILIKTEKEYKDLSNCVKKSNNYLRMYYCNKDQTKDTNKNYNTIKNISNNFTQETFKNLKKTLLLMMKNNYEIKKNCIDNSTDSYSLKYCISK